MEAKRGRDDDIDVSSRRVFDWAGHFPPVPYERDRVAPAKRSTYTSPASSRAWERSDLTPWYHTNVLEGSAANAVTGNSRWYQQSVRCFLRSKNEEVHIGHACLLIYIYIVC